MQYMSMKNGLGVYIADEKDDPATIDVCAHNIGVLCLLLANIDLPDDIKGFLTPGAFTPVQEINVEDTVDTIKKAGIQIEEL